MKTPPQPNNDFLVGHYSEGPNYTQNQTNVGKVRDIETIVTPPKSLIDEPDVVKQIPFQVLLHEMEKRIPVEDQKEYQTLKMLHSGEHYAQNPKVIRDKLQTIVNSDKNPQTSRPILLELCAMFANYYPEFLQK